MWNSNITAQTLLEKKNATLEAKSRSEDDLKDLLKRNDNWIALSQNKRQSS